MALLGVLVFGDLEYWLSMIKVITYVLFIIVGILVDVGAVGDGFIGDRNCFGSTELVGITAGESENPGKAIPKATRRTFWRIMIFFILSVTVIGLVIPWMDENLLDGQIACADHAINAILLLSVLLAGQSAYYALACTLMAMRREGKMPAIVGRVNSRGVPLYSLAPVTLVACVAFVADVVGTGVVFTWLVNLTGMPARLTWLSISVVHLRFRTAYKAQGRSIKDLPYITPFFPYSCYISFLLALMIAFLEGYQVVTADPFVVEDVITVFAGAPVFFFSIIGWKLYHKTKLVPLLEVDLDSDRPTIIQGISSDSQQQELRTEEDKEKEREAQLPRWKRTGLKVLRFIA
ncbi:hypothetical protein BGW39_011281 [Mortierella sp. 14UC]|nr:hypothetical protein BGW39_011281 [Mortierella sp. 14UC]